MKNLFSILALGLSLSLYAGHHEEGEKDASMHENNFVYISTYTQPAGGNPERLKKSLLKNLDTLEANGYNRCGMLRHQFGGGRSFLTYCYFDSWEQFAEINDSNNPIAGDGPRQLYGDHTDKLAAVVVRNLTKQTPYVLEAKYSFGPYLTDNERRANAKNYLMLMIELLVVATWLSIFGVQNLHGTSIAAMRAMQTGLIK